MTLVRKSSLSFIAALAIIFSFSAFSFAKSNKPDVPGNFGQLDERFYRGGRPKVEELKTLASLGVKTIIDLTDNSRAKEQPAVEAAGMRYVNIPIVDKKNPSEAQIAEFLKIVNDPETGKFYVHCAGGRHRTGVMAAVYRFHHDNWNYDQAYAEMLKFDFYTSNGHGKQLDFVKDYWNQLQARNVNAAAATATGR